MKRLFLFLVAALAMLNVMAGEKNISPTACGITVGQTTKTGKTLAQWGDILKDYRPMTLITTEKNQEVYLGDFVVEGFHMSMLNMELINDTVYQLSFYEKSPYADCWDAYKDLAFKLRDKYAHFEDVTDPVVHETDSAVSFFKTDGKTQILFAAYPNSISLTLINVHFNEIWVHRLTDGLNSVLSGKSGPNYDEKNKVTSVAGVNFGDSKENVKRVISAKSDRLLQSDEYSLNFYKVRVGGTTYEYAKFYFKKGEGLVSVNLQQPFRSWRKEEALMMYENTKSVYQRKYTNYRDVVDEDENKGGVCGAYEDGYMPIIISFTKSLSQGGDIMYYVQVDYFHNRIATLYDNDI